MLLSILEKYGEQNSAVILSLDGATAETHDSIRMREGSFERLEDTARRLVEAGYRIKANTCLNQQNQNQLEALVELGEAWKLSEIKFAGVIPVPGNEALRLSDAESIALFEEIQKLRTKTEMKLDISSALFTSGGVDFCPVLGLKSLAFDSQGQMIYCCDAQASDSVIGSLSEHSLAELLSKRVEVTQSIQKERILRITRGQMGEGFNTCTFCAEYFQ